MASLTYFVRHVLCGLNPWVICVLDITKIHVSSSFYDLEELLAFRMKDFL